MSLKWRLMLSHPRRDILIPVHRLTITRSAISQPVGNAAFDYHN